MILLAVPAGLLIGASLGALGGGGSILTVPALVYLLGQSAHQATTVSLMVVGTAAAVGALVHARGGRVRLKAGAAFGGLGIAGSYAGSRASAAVPANVLLAGFGLLMLAVAVMMILRRRGQAQRTQGAAPAGGARHAILVGAAATGVGLITGFFGVGGGFVVVPALVLVLGFDMPTAAGTSLVVIAVNRGIHRRRGDRRPRRQQPGRARQPAAAERGVHPASPYRGRLHAHPQPPRPAVTRRRTYTLPGILRQVNSKGDG